jgi:hypothetical protein
MWRWMACTHEESWGTRGLVPPLVSCVEMGGKPSNGDASKQPAESLVCVRS